MGSTARLVLMTAPDPAVAERLVMTLVEERLVACGNILPGLTSIYRWQGAVEQAAEALILLKTQDGTVPELLARAAALHPYEVPEILVLSVDAGLDRYLEWIEQSVESGARTNDDA